MLMSGGGDGPFMNGFRYKTTNLRGVEEREKHDVDPKLS